MKFSKKLEYMRKKRNISQTQVAKKLGVSRQTVYKWEADINKPEFDKIEKLAELFEISYNLLLDDSIDLPKYFGDDLSTEEHLPERDILDENISMENKIIDKRLPFILGIIAIIVLALIAISVGFIVNYVSNDGNDTSTKADTTIDTAIILEITFNAGEGELIGEKNASIAYGSVMNNIPAATKSKYVFLGWYDENDVKLDATTKHYQNKIYTAKYAEKTVTVYFNPGEGTVSEQERTVPIGTKIGELPIPVREGYAFVCWRANKRIINSDTIIDIDVVVNAVWSDQNETVKITLDSNGGNLIESVLWVLKDEYLIDYLPTPTHPDNLQFAGWFTEKGVLVTRNTKFSEDVTLTAQFGAINICPVSGENHNWSDWDEKNSAPTCTDNGTRTRYCYDCLYKFTETTNEALNHSYGEWSYGRMKQERQCQRCFLVSTVQYVNLYEQIEKIQITGEVFASDNWTCLYDGDWEQEYPVFCGKNNPVTVDIALKGEIFVDCIFVKGASDCTYTISVLYAEDNDYTVISTEGKFGEKEMRFDINGEITDVKVYMENATPEGYWQEIAIAKIPEVEQ